MSREMEDGIEWLGVATSLDHHSVGVSPDANRVTDAIQKCVAAEHTTGDVDSNQLLNTVQLMPPTMGS